VAVLVVKMVVIMLVVEHQLDLVEDLGVVVERRDQDLLDNQEQTHPGMDLLIMEMPVAVARQVLHGLPVVEAVLVVLVNLTPLTIILEMVEMEEQVPLHMDHPSQ
tara:strand:- start:162 stop:476 length:315 start_codon:yes stop_codon:yes gene_type:complete